MDVIKILSTIFILLYFGLFAFYIKDMYYGKSDDINENAKYQQK